MSTGSIGEYEAFRHILNSASGVGRVKIDELFGATVPRTDRDQLATLIYYPREKLEEIERETGDMREWYRITFHRLIDLCCLVSLVSHQPFAGRAEAIRKNWDITSTSQIFERLESRATIRDTDDGRRIQAQIDDLLDLLRAYRSGAIVEGHKT